MLMLCRRQEAMATADNDSFGVGMTIIAAFFANQLCRLLEPKRLGYTFTSLILLKATTIIPLELSTAIQRGNQLFAFLSSGIAKIKAEIEDHAPDGITQSKPN